jgi:hypothetical protein
MTLDIFVKRMQKEIEDFQEWYLAQRQRAGAGEDDWPIRGVEEQDWQEQFIIWQGLSEEVKNS